MKLLKNSDENREKSVFRRIFCIDIHTKGENERMIVREEDMYISYAIICIIHLHFHLVVKKEREKVFLERRTKC